MKKFLVAILVMLLCLSFTACGNDKYQEYDNLINYLEQGDYEAARAEIDTISAIAKSKEDANKTTEDIDITIDNWQDYFEIEERILNNKNDFGEITEVYKKYYLVLKDGYELAEQGTSIAIEYSYICEWRYVEEDKQAGTLTVGELVPDRDNLEYKDITKTITSSEFCLQDSRSWTDGAQAVPTNIKISRMQGKLCIMK